MSRLVNMLIFFHVSIHISCLTVPDAINIDNKGEVWGIKTGKKALYFEFSWAKEKPLGAEPVSFMKKQLCFL